MISKLEKGKRIMFGNIEIHHGMDGSLRVCSTGGPMYNQGLIKVNVHCIQKRSVENPENYCNKIWKEPIDRVKQIGLHEE